MKTVFHIDMDAFFVSVEELYNPELKGKPVVVGGRPDQRGVVSAASYAARKFGVHSAMPLRTAHKLCPQAIFVEGHPHRYREHSEKVFAVLNRFSPQVEMASIDEAYIDLTGAERLHGPPLHAAHKLHEQIRTATKLNCSIGVATSRLVAKICSDQAKPNGVLWILPSCEARFLAPLDVRKIPDVGKVTEKTLHSYGIRKIGDLAKLDRKFLEEKLGKWGLALAGKAQGLDAGGWFEGEIGDGDEPKSISHETTFDVDTKDRGAHRNHTGKALGDGWEPAAGASAPCTDHPVETALLGLLHLHPGTHARPRHPTRHRPHRAVAPAVSGELEWEAGAASGSACLRTPTRRGSIKPARRGAARSLEEGASCGRPHPRPLWNGERVDCQFHGRGFPGTRARESGRSSGETA